MSTYIDITLINFKCHLNKTIRLVQGSNLIKGDSGKGKSTICKAIQFVLYGGRKFKDVQNWLHTKERTEVIFHYTSPTTQYRITRSRPSESLFLQLQDSTGFYEIHDLAAQEWINGNYGVENIWLASSYISRKKAHFLLEANNNDKMELLQRIAFGDLSPMNQPDFYLQKTKAEIFKYSEQLKVINENMRIQQSIRTSILQRNPAISSSEYISLEKAEELKLQLVNSKSELDNLQQLYVSIKTRREIANQLSLIVIPESYEQQIELIKKIKEKMRLMQKTRDFDKDIIDNNIDSDHYLYTRYREHGFISNIEKFLEEKEREYKIYLESLDTIKRNDDINKRNIELQYLNNSMRKEYERLLCEYNNIKSEIDELSKDIELVRIDDEDSMSHEYALLASDKIKLDIEDMKRKHYENSIQRKKIMDEYRIKYNIYHSYITSVENIKSNILLLNPTSINDSDDLSSEFITNYKKENDNKIISLSETMKDFIEYNTKMNEINDEAKIKYERELYNYNRYSEKLILYRDNLLRLTPTHINQLDNLSLDWLIEYKKHIETKIKEIETSIKEVYEYNTKMNEVNDEIKIKYQRELYNYNKYSERLILYRDNLSRLSPTHINQSDDLSLDWLIDYKLLIETKVLKLETNIKEIDEYNLSKTDLNKAFKKAYDKQMSDYNNIMSSIAEHKNKKKNLEFSMDESNSDVYMKMSSKDDLSSSWLIGFKAAIDMSLKELICPNCNRGLTYENGILNLGTIECGDSKEKYRKQLSLIELEYNKRVKREKLILEISEFNKITIREEPDLPEIPKYYDLKEYKLGKDNIYEVLEKYRSINLSSEFNIREEIKRINNSISSLNVVDKPEVPKYHELKDIKDIKGELDKYRSINLNSEIDLRNKLKCLKDELSKLQVVSEPVLEELVYLCEDEIDKANELFGLINKQILVRSNIDKLNRLSLPCLPTIPKYHKMVDLLNINIVREPKLKTFDIPKYSYDKYQSMYKSKSMIEDYLKLKSMDHVIIDDVSQYDDLLSKQKNRFEQIKNKERLESILSTLPEDDISIESRIKKLYDNINVLNHQISIANSFREIELVDVTIKQISDQINAIIKYLEKLEYFYNKTEQISMNILENKIIDVNTPLSSILQDLFIDPIDVRLSPYKELKNGNTKLQINFVIDYKGMTLGNMDGFSDGEEGRLSLSLLIAFSRMNNNPFIIIDEVLSSMNDKLRSESVDLVDKWTAGKFVIHICHSVVEGQHYNVIEL